MSGISGMTREWLRAEAERQGLPLSEGDLEAIFERVAAIKAALAAQRPEATEGLEPPYQFVSAPMPSSSTVTSRSIS